MHWVGRWLICWGIELGVWGNSQLPKLSFDNHEDSIVLDFSDDGQCRVHASV